MQNRKSASGTPEASAVEALDLLDSAARLYERYVELAVLAKDVEPDNLLVAASSNLSSPLDLVISQRRNANAVLE